jgi:hypothetical protein
VRRFAPDDDLLAGFDRAGRPAGLRTFFATTIAASLLVWDLTFSLGAYHTVFYYRLFQILVASTVEPSNCRNVPTPTPAQSTSPTPSQTQ